MLKFYNIYNCILHNKKKLCKKKNILNNIKIYKYIFFIFAMRYVLFMQILVFSLTDSNLKNFFQNSKKNYTK